jgi:glutathione synthase/RimK-type ligase-like ATP-grasp enzyme
MILILSTPLDEHAQTVMAELLKLDTKSQLLDLSEFPQKLRLSLFYEDGKHRFLFGCDEQGLKLEDCRSIWWRRPQQPVISKEIIRDTHRNFAMNEVAEALQGLWQSLNAFWINDPLLDQAASRKVYQLCIAQDVGLEIPSTLISTCPGSVREFIARKKFDNVIYKAFSATEAEWRETRLLRKNELDLIDNVRFAPVIFQDYIEAEVDLRVTVVGDDIFAAAINSQETSYKVDFRIDMGKAHINEVRLPDEIEKKLHALMKRLGLVYGAIDMRLTPDGRYVFLEINPAGQWLFIEQQTGQKISRAIARMLKDHDRK